MTTTPQGASAELLPCPFCGGEARIESNRDWHRIYAAHDDDCIFDADDHDSMYPAQPGYLKDMAANWNRRAAQPAAPTEELVRYCPGCGSVGPVGAEYRDCCPDGSEARHIPKALAEKCHETFKLAIKQLAASPQVEVAPQAEQVAKAESIRGAALHDAARAFANGPDWVERSNVVSWLRARAGFAATPERAAAPADGDIEWGHDLQTRLMAASQDITESDEARNVMAEAACLLASLTGRAAHQASTAEGGAA